MKTKVIKMSQYERKRHEAAINALIKEAVKVADSEVPKVKNTYSGYRWNKYYLRAMNRLTKEEGLRCA